MYNRLVGTCGNEVKTLVILSANLNGCKITSDGMRIRLFSRADTEKGTKHRVSVLSQLIERVCELIAHG